MSGSGDYGASGVPASGIIYAGGFAGAVVTVGIWAAQTFLDVEIPAMLAAPLTTIVATIGAVIYATGHWILRKWE
jgi:hypothetical protein